MWSTCFTCCLGSLVLIREIFCKLIPFDLDSIYIEEMCFNTSNELFALRELEGLPSLVGCSA